MSPLISETHVATEIAPNPHVIRELPILVILPHSRCNCRCMMCDIWRIRQIREITAQDLEPHLAGLRELKVRWVVFSGGEPLMHSDLSALARLLRREGIRLTLLTAGLILERHAVQVAEDMDDVIVSLDGPREIHDRIRGVPDAYRRLERGIRALRERRAGMPIHARCTVQKNNIRHLLATVRAAEELGLNSISFLAADIMSEAFNHSVPMSESARGDVVLDSDDLGALETGLGLLATLCKEQMRSGFIRESPEKLRRIALHFRAHFGQAPPAAPRCNAPWVSAVIESDGSVRPCFFHRPFGNIRGGTFVDVLNNEAAVEFRSQLNISENPTCRRCVCSLFLEGTPPA
ncbi:MAG: radical SAM protein [Terriglobia bacterium]